MNHLTDKSNLLPCHRTFYLWTHDAIFPSL